MNTGPENPNLGQFLAAVAALEPLLDQVVFVGGCATGLLLTDPAAAPVRPTLDVDVIVEAASYAGLVALEGELRRLGFDQPRTEGTPVCRWVRGTLLVDFMPTDPAILGFSNRWYGPAMQQARRMQVGGKRIRLIAAPHFIATKLEALQGRGREDYPMSHDLEDIISVVDGRPEIVEEVQFANYDLRRYLSDEFRKLLSKRDFRDALPGHLLPDAASQQRLGIVVERLRSFITED